MGNEFMRGASASLTKTMKEIDLILDGETLAQEGKLRQKLREQLMAAMANVAIDWLKHGFVGGHTVAAREYATRAVFPTKIQIEINREIPIRGAGTTVSIILTSKLKKKDRPHEES